MANKITMDMNVVMNHILKQMIDNCDDIKEQGYYPRDFPYHFTECSEPLGYDDLFAHRFEMNGKWWEFEYQSKLEHNCHYLFDETGSDWQLKKWPLGSFKTTRDGITLELQEVVPVETTVITYEHV